MGTSVKSVAAAATSTTTRTSVGYLRYKACYDATEVSCRRGRGRDGVAMGNTLFKKAPV
jgi:hypothetical protein